MEEDSGVRLGHSANWMTLDDTTATGFATNAMSLPPLLKVVTRAEEASTSPV
jgi:hypothetical protein